MLKANRDIVPSWAMPACCAAVVFLSLILVSCNSTGDLSESPTVEPNEYDRNDARIQYPTSQRDRIGRTDPTHMVLYQISFKKWLTIDELRALLSTDGAPQGTSRLNLLLPNAADGTRISIDGDSDTGEIELVDEEIARLVGNRVDNSPLATHDEWASDIRSGADGGGYLVGSIRAYGGPESVLEWWDEHPESIFVLQTIENEFDMIQQAFEPGGYLQ